MSGKRKSHRFLDSQHLHDEEVASVRLPVHFRERSRCLKGEKDRSSLSKHLPERMVAAEALAGLQTLRLKECC
ncbi:hypothetical protein E2C01_059511 [Portunus trituberculatus]|uniref:Uncharacterized protein n=1 Tax=Portunus trituberculatus TaxID=210409 RepID=A0A5B7H7Y6_PORTR|nr:hypothetical protein [Portunus trituberculatus]